MPEHELVLEPECKEITRLHTSTRYRLAKQGKFPRSFKIGDPDAPNGRVAWLRAEILAWLADRMAARDGTPRDAASAEETAAPVEMSIAAVVPSTPRRGRGRPRKSEAPTGMAAATT